MTTDKQRKHNPIIFNPEAVAKANGKRSKFNPTQEDIDNAKAEYLARGGTITPSGPTICVCGSMYDDVNGYTLIGNLKHFVRERIGGAV